MSSDWIIPDWPAPANVRSVITTRHGGVSKGPYQSMNCGDHVDDDPEHVKQNRIQLASFCDLPESSFAWLRQVHGTKVKTISAPFDHCVSEADASFTWEFARACVIMTADCLPVLFCDKQGSAVAAAHAGWRGLAAGVLEQTLAQFEYSADVMAYLGPAISQTHFEVGAEVREAFVSQCSEHALAFCPASNKGKYLADLYLLARQKLQRAGVSMIFGGGRCTFAESEAFFSYRRDGETGRMASVIFLDGSHRSTA